MSSNHGKSEETNIHIDLHDDFNTDVPAVVYTQGAFDGPQGKTAHRLLHQGDIFNVEAIIDAESDGETVLDIYPSVLSNKIPIYSSYAEAAEAHRFEAFLVGTAPLGGELSSDLVETVKQALTDDLDIVSGMHQHLIDRDDLREFANNSDGEIHDIRKAPPHEKLRDADGRTDDLEADVVTVMGTDCVTGKGTTTYELYDAAKSEGIDVAFVATGQTGILTGSRYGIPTDKIPVEYAVGAVEQVVYEAGQSHDLIFVEAQAALTHPRFVGDDVLKGSRPDCVVLADNPSNQCYEYFEIPKKGVQKEIEMIEIVGDTKVVAIATQSDDTEAVEEQYGVPAENVLEESGRERIFTEVMSHLED